MVSNAKEDFPDPDRPVITTNFSFEFQEKHFSSCVLCAFYNDFFQHFFLIKYNHLIFTFQI